MVCHMILLNRGTRCTSIATHFRPTTTTTTTTPSRHTQRGAAVRTQHNPKTHFLSSLPLLCFIFRIWPRVRICVSAGDCALLTRSRSVARKVHVRGPPPKCVLKRSATFFFFVLFFPVLYCTGPFRYIFSVHFLAGEVL